MSSSWYLLKSIESALGVSLPWGWASDWAAVVFTTSAAMILGFVMLVWRRSLDKAREAKPVVSLKAAKMEAEEEDDGEVESGKTKITVFFGTQTGTAEGFAKVRHSIYPFKYLYSFCRLYCSRWISQSIFSLSNWRL